MMRFTSPDRALPARREITADQAIMSSRLTLMPARNAACRLAPMRSAARPKVLRAMTNQHRSATTYVHTSQCRTSSTGCREAGRNESPV